MAWKFIWSISTFYSIQVGKQHCFKDGILLHSKNGEIFEIYMQHDNIPHIEVIYTDEIEYKALFPISQCTDHVATVDRLDRLCIFELLTGKLTARLSLKHHGEGKINIKQPKQTFNFYLKHIRHIFLIS